MQAKEEHVWADITVASVIDGGHFWAQVGGEIVDEKLRDIRNILQKEASIVLGQLWRRSYKQKTD